MGHIRRAGAQQRAHQVGAVIAEHKYVLLVFDRAEALEQGGTRFGRL